MPLKYEIWEYVGSGEHKNDVFLIDNYAKYADVSPNDSASSFNVERQEDQAFYRVVMAGDLIFSGDDFQIIYNITSDDNECKMFLLLVMDNSPAGRSDFIKNNFWDKADFIGMIKKRSIEYDYNRCVARLMPETFDIYTGFLREYDEEHNLLNIISEEEKVWVEGRGSGIDGVLVGEYEMEYERIDKTISYSSTPPIPFYHSQSHFFLKEDVSKYAFIGLANGGQALLNDSINESNFTKGLLKLMEVQNFVFSKPIPDSGSIEVLAVIQYSTIFYREVVYLPESETPEGEGWEIIDDSEPQIKWCRTPLNITAPYYSFKDLSPENIDDVVYDDLPYDLNGYTLDGARVYLYKISAQDMPPRKRGVKLIDGINALRKTNEAVNEDDDIKTKSTFFKKMLNPITDTADFRYMVLLQASDAKPTTDPATKLEISTHGILEILKYLNLNWILEAPNATTIYPVLRIEHDRYFKRGGAYSGDVEIGYYVPKKDQRLIISYDDNTPPKKEIISVQSSISPDFTTASIHYPAGCSGDNNMEKSFPVITDMMPFLVGIEMPKDGVILMQTTRGYSLVPSYNYPVITEVYTIINKGEFAGLAQMNGGLSVKSVLEDLWIDGRYLKKGRFSFNEEETQFQNIKKQSMHSNVPIRKSYKQIEPYKLVATDYGNGEIKIASFDIKNCIWKAKLAYE